MHRLNSSKIGYHWQISFFMVLHLKASRGLLHVMNIKANNDNVLSCLKKRCNLAFHQAWNTWRHWQSVQQPFDFFLMFFGFGIAYQRGLPHVANIKAFGAQPAASSSQVCLSFETIFILGNLYNVKWFTCNTIDKNI